jgi:hypothetical protein
MDFLSFAAIAALPGKGSAIRAADLFSFFMFHLQNTVALHTRLA